MNIDADIEEDDIDTVGDSIEEIETDSDNSRNPEIVSPAADTAVPEFRSEHGIISGEHAELDFERLIKLRKFYAAYPDRWLKSVTGEDVWWKQREIMRSVAVNSRVSVASCNSSGKSFLSSRLVLWFLNVYSPAIVITTAPSNRQVEFILWREIQRGYMNAARRGITFGEPPLTTQWKIDNDRYAIGFAPRDYDPDAMQGFHCLSDEHEILTRRGWLTRSELTVNDEVFSLNLRTDFAEWKSINAIHQYDFDGELNVLNGKSLSFAITDNHRLVAKGQTNNWALREFSDLPNTFWLRKTSKWKGNQIEIPKSFVRAGFNLEAFARFVGFWLAEGSVITHKETGLAHDVVLYQVKPDGIKYLKSAFSHIKFRENYKCGFCFSNRSIAEWLITNCGERENKHIPEFMLDGSWDVLWWIFESFAIGDGSFRDMDTDIDRIAIYGTVKRLIDQLQEISVKLGLPGTIGINRKAGAMVGKRAPGGIIRSSQTCYVLSIPMAGHDPIVFKEESQSVACKAPVIKQRYKGIVWCISTEYETFLTRRNGRIFWSGNSKHMLIIIDEAAQINDDIYDGIESVVRGSDYHILAISNPTAITGRYYNTFKSANWVNHHISAFHSPNVINKNVELPGIITQQDIDACIEEYGLDSWQYRIFIEGRFPDKEEGSLIALDWLVQAASRNATLADQQSAVEIGADIARFGSDQSVFIARRGFNFFDVETHKHKSTMEICGLLLNFTDRVRHGGLATVRVDTINMGAGVLDRFREVAPPDVKLIEMIGSTKARNPLKYTNAVCEWWDTLAGMLKSGIASGEVFANKRVVSDLISRKARMLSNGLMMLESKKTLRESPDYGDAAAMCAAGGAVGYGARKHLRVAFTRKPIRKAS